MRKGHGDALKPGRGGIVRRLHDAAADCAPPRAVQGEVAIPAVGADLVCHHDLAPWNLIRDGDTWIFIDWDASAPGWPGISIQGS